MPRRATTRTVAATIAAVGIAATVALPASAAQGGGWWGDFFGRSRTSDGSTTRTGSWHQPGWTSTSRSATATPAAPTKTAPTVTSDSRPPGVTASLTTASPTDAPSSITPSTAVPTGDQLYGLTLDDVSDVSGIVKMLTALPRRATVRIVFDEGEPASAYRAAVTAIAPHADIMGQLLDSTGMAKTSTAAYRLRAQEYVSAFGSQVALWEIGNEINGEWLGAAKDVVAKLQAADEVVRAAGGKTALTLYYNHECWERPANEMFTWAETQLPETLRRSVDHVFVSYYEDDCNGYRPPSWTAEFDHVRALFPAARLGFGEVGLPYPATPTTLNHATDVLNRYYRLSVSTPGYEGGYFWWYAAEDLVGADRPLLAAMQLAWA